LPNLVTFDAISTELPFAGDVEFGYKYFNISHRTYYQSEIIYERGIRIRTVKGVVRHETFRDVILELFDATKGRNLPFEFIPDTANMSDVWPMRWSEDTLRIIRQAPQIVDIRIEMEEVSPGLIP
jgi:hypothetical protein